MNGYREDNSFCYFHTEEILIGVCALCLNERLLLLAAKQPTQNPSTKRFRGGFISQRKTSINNYLPKIFAFTSLLNRHSKSENLSDHHGDAGGDGGDDHDTSTTASREESFISIKFENNEVSSWEKDKACKVNIDNCSISLKNHRATAAAAVVTKPPLLVETNKSMIEHVKSRVTSLRWRKRIGHLFQLVRLKKSSNACHVATKVEGVKLRKSWMRVLTKRKSKRL